MATLHTEKAGQWMKEQAWNAIRRELLVLFILVCGMIFLIGLGLGLTWGKAGWTVALASLGTAAVALLVMRLVDRLQRRWELAAQGRIRRMRLVDRLQRRWELAAQGRIRRLRGAHAEALIAYVLKMQLDDDTPGVRPDAGGGWHVWSNVPLGDLGDADHVVVGPGGLFVVSVKSHLGLLRVGGDGLTLNNRPKPWPDEAVEQAFRLRDRLNAIGGIPPLPPPPPSAPSCASPTPPWNPTARPCGAATPSPATSGR